LEIETTSRLPTHKDIEVAYLTIVLYRLRQTVLDIAIGDEGRTRGKKEYLKELKRILYKTL